MTKPGLKNFKNNIKRNLFYFSFEGLISILLTLIKLLKIGEPGIFLIFFYFFIFFLHVIADKYLENVSLNLNFCFQVLTLTPPTLNLNSESR